jgi:MFS family permease
MTITTDPLVRDPAAAARGRWLMLIVLLAGQFMALLDVTIVNVAMPTIGRSLHATGAELQLVVAGYTVSYAMMLITGARLGELYGRRRVFMAGVAVFTVASLTCGIAPGVGVLIGARFVQGAGAAAMMPQIMSVIQLRFDGAARARALSAYTAVLSSGFVAGQVIGGVLVTANLFGQTWRPVFLVNVPIGLAVLALVPRVVADEPGSLRGQHRRRLDLAGLAIAVPAVFLVVLPLMLGHQEDWPSWVFACIALGLVLAAAFVGVERRIADRGGDPLLNLAVLRAPGLVPGLAAVAVLMITYGGFLFSFALHLQAGLGEDALRAGLTFAPCALVFGACGFFWRRLPERVHHLLAPAGCLVAVGGYLAVAAALHSGRGGAAQQTALQAALVVTGAALALGFSPLVTHSLVRVPLQHAADASGLLTTTIQLGQAIGVATFGSLFLTLDAGRGGPVASGHAVAVTLGWLAAAMVLAVVAGVPLARTVAAARRPSDGR